MTLAALGFRAHTGWAAMVALAGEVANPNVIDRRRVELVSAQQGAAVYHAARERDLATAREMVAHAIGEAHSRTRSEIAAAVDDLAARGSRVLAVGVIAGNAPLPTQLERILGSHALVHAAEGQLFRDALVAGGRACGLFVTTVPPNHLYDELAAALDVDDREVARRLAVFGKAAGRPWAQDQKEAALAAWMALVRRAPLP
jgi:hypothetical protein